MFSVTLMTIDRSPKQNFLGRTLENLKRAGVFDSPLLSRFSIIDSGSKSLEFIETELHRLDLVNKVWIHSGERIPTANAAFALKVSSESGAPWSLFLEDDIDVCGQFLESAAAWLTEFGTGFRVFPLGANYDIICALYKNGHKFYKYPIWDYYGTLAVAIRASDARSISSWLEARKMRQEYDLLIAEWAHDRGITHFLTPAPSFVQHIGNESVIRPGSEFHEYRSWQGPSWSYSQTVSGGVQ